MTVLSTHDVRLVSVMHHSNLAASEVDIFNKFSVVMGYSICTYFNIVFLKIQVLRMFVLLQGPNLKGRNGGPLSLGVHKTEIESTDLIEILVLLNHEVSFLFSYYEK